MCIFLLGHTFGCTNVTISRVLTREVCSPCMVSHCVIPQTAMYLWYILLICESTSLTSGCNQAKQPTYEHVWWWLLSLSHSQGLAQSKAFGWYARPLMHTGYLCDLVCLQNFHLLCFLTTTTLLRMAWAWIWRMKKTKRRQGGYMSRSRRRGR